MSIPIAVVPARPAQDPYAPHPPYPPVFHGSPVSLRSGSFQNRFYPAGSPAHSLGPIAMPDFKRGPAAWDTDPAAPWLPSTSPSANDDLCRNYICCGVPLPDLHALVEHFESCHVEVILSHPSHPHPPPPPPGTPGTAPMTSAATSITSPAPHIPPFDDPDGTPAFDADDMDISEPSPSPPATPAQSAFDPVRVDAAMSLLFRAPYTSSYSSLAGANGPPAPSPATTAFNRYAGYADYSSALPGTDPSPAYVYDGAEKHAFAAQMQMQAGRCVPPALLFAGGGGSASPSPLNTPASSRTGSPAPLTGVLSLHPGAGPSTGSGTKRAQQQQHATIGAGASALAKPFRCPKAGCNKSYKQQNGLKYHLSHGQCNFAPRDPAVEALSEAERERRLRPFVCAVGPAKDCGRRYKNMNGLRYHYTHTGEHGARGLELLAQGQHPLPEVSTTGSPASSAPQSIRSSPQPQQMQVQPQYMVPPALSPFPVRAWE